MLDRVKEMFACKVSADETIERLTYHGHERAAVEASIEKLCRHGYIEKDGVVECGGECELTALDKAVLYIMEDETSNHNFHLGGWLLIGGLVGFTLVCAAYHLVTEVM